MTILQAVRGKELATKREGGASILKPTAVRSTEGTTRTQMLPSDPMEVVKIFESRRKKSPALRTKAKLAAELAKRTGR